MAELKKKIVIRKIVKSTLKKPVVRRASKKAKKITPELERFIGNPIITPNSTQPWRARATFNPAAAYFDGTVHLLYRAVGETDESVLGYANSLNGVTINQEALVPAYDRAMRHLGVNIQTPYSSGGGTNGGCEDPRMTKLGEYVYVIYTAFDGWGSVRLALTSIKAADLKHQQWHWRKPIFISPPGQIHKNWSLFPELVGGKYAVLTSISPEVRISYFDKIADLNGKRFIQSIYYTAPRKGVWDTWLRGAGPPPMRTKYGWLLLYHAMDYSDPNRYKLGAMVLDINDPTKVLYRCQEPILEPDEWYENNGFKSGVIYSCGAVIKDGQLIVYYGGADTVACVATAPIDAFMDQLVSTGRPKLASRRAHHRS